MPEEKVPEEKIIAFCVKCKQKKEMKEPTEVVIKGKGGTKRRALKGTCSDCGTKMFRILGKA